MGTGGCSGVVRECQPRFQRCLADSSFLRYRQFEKVQHHRTAGQPFRHQLRHIAEAAQATARWIKADSGENGDLRLALEVLAQIGIERHDALLARLGSGEGGGGER